MAVDPPSRIAIGLLVSLIMLGGAGCSSATAGAPTPAPQQVELSGTFENGCSPVDASGIIFNLRAPQMDGWIQISMWDNLPISSGTVVSLASEENVALAAYCLATNDCEVARLGELHVVQAGESTMRGDLWLEFPVLGSIQGSFEATWVDAGPVVCG